MYTKGEWKVYPKGRHFVVDAGRPYSHNVIANVPYSLANAHLIVAAVNACQKVNPDNPMAVAKSIPDMYEALLSALGSLVVLGMENQSWGQEILQNITQALAKATGRKV